MIRRSHDDPRPNVILDGVKMRGPRGEGLKHSSGGDREAIKILQEKGKDKNANGLAWRLL